MKYSGLVMMVFGLAVLAGVALLWAYPQPSAAPSGWQLDFESGPMCEVRLDRPGQEPKIYWYLTYTVTNNSGRDVDFYPQCWLLTDTGQLVRAMVGVDALAYPDIAKSLGNPLLEEELFVRGKVIQGQENARESVIIFSDFDPKAASFMVFISGLSDEVAWVEDPLTGQKSPLVKTLQLSYAVPGDRGVGHESQAELKDKEWIMR